MKRKFPELEKIDPKGEIDTPMMNDLADHLKRALLAALEETGKLNRIQYRMALERMRRYPAKGEGE